MKRKVFTNIFKSKHVGFANTPSRCKMHNCCTCDILDFYSNRYNNNPIFRSFRLDSCLLQDTRRLQYRLRYLRNVKIMKENLSASKLQKVVSMVRLFV